MLADFLLQSTNAPGVATNCNLIAAATGRRNFAQAFTTGAVAFYYLDDGTQAEWGYGTLTTGTPDVFSRDTVLGNTAGTTARLNFTGLTRIYNEIPAANCVYRDITGAVVVKEPANGTNTLTVSATSGSNGANLRLAGNGSTTPNKWLRAYNGALQVVNSAYTTNIFSLSDAGAISIPGMLTASSITAGLIAGSAGLQVTGFDNANGGQLRAIGGNYGALVRNDGTSCYLMSTASGQQTGSYNAYRPFYWTLASGAVVIDGGTTTGGTTFGGTVTMNGLLTASAGINTATIAATNYLKAASYIQAQATSAGGVSLVSGDATHTGYLAFWNSAATRCGYIGYSPAGSTINFITDAGGGRNGWAFDQTLWANALNCNALSAQTLTTAGGISCGGTLGVTSNIACASFGTSQYVVVGTTLNVGSTITAGGSISATGTVSATGNLKPGGGIVGKQGISGAAIGNAYNFWWSGTALEAWVDSTRIGNVSLSSDLRYKQDVTPLADGALALVADLAPISYRWQDNGVFRDDGVEHVGFGAQDVLRVLPSAVSGDPDSDTDILSLDPLPILALLVKAVQELRTAVDALSA